MKKILRILLTLFIFLFIVFLVNAVQVYVYSKKTFDNKSDVALVLGAGTNNGKLSPVFRERINHSINLLKTGKVEIIILTGGIGKGETISDSRVGGKYLIEQGVDESQFLLEEKSTLTLQNICNSKKIMTERNLNSALIVSDPYHMKRAMKMCEKVGLKGLPAPTPTSMYISKKVKRKFLINQAWNYWLYVFFQQHVRIDC